MKGQSMDFLKNYSREILQSLDRDQLYTLMMLELAKENLERDHELALVVIVDDKPMQIWNPSREDINEGLKGASDYAREVNAKRVLIIGDANEQVYNMDTQEIKGMEDIVTVTLVRPGKPAWSASVSYKRILGEGYRFGEVEMADTKVFSFPEWWNKTNKQN